MRGRLFFWALTAALAGFLFGFDTVVISGAEQTIQELWGLSPLTHGMAISMALWGTVAGATTKSPGTLGKRLRLPVMLAFLIAWVKLMVPEAKGRPLEQLEHGL